MRRLFAFAPILTVTAVLIALPACGKKGPPGVPGAPADPSLAGPAVAASEFAAFVHFDGKTVLGSELFAEVKKGLLANGGKDWEKMEANTKAELGVKPTDVASVSIYVMDFPVANDPQLGGAPSAGAPKIVGIMTAEQPFDKAAVLKSMNAPGAAPDARGFYSLRGGPGLLHFADDKTAAIVHPELADKYLAGFAKDRSGWPVSVELQKAAGGHAVFAALNVAKLPAAAKAAPDAKQFAALLAAKTAAVMLDLDGKAATLSARATFPDAASAEQAKGVVTQFIPFAQLMLGGIGGGPGGPGGKSDMGALQPAMTALATAVQGIKVETSGADLTATVKYAADFDIPAAVAEAVKKVGGASDRMADSNNLKQIGLALHNYAGANSGQMPVFAIAKGGKPVAGQADKPLLSWRVAILPYIEQENLYNQFKLDEPWDSANNKKLIPLMPKTFSAPGEKAAKPGFTRYQMVIGEAAMPPRAAFMPRTFADGTSNTIAVVEAAEAVEWTKPADVMVGGKVPATFRRKFGGLLPGGFNAVLWDGSVRFIPNSVGDETLRGALTPSGGELLGSDW